MILTRLGNKQNLIKKIYNHFPAHKMRIEFFFGAGGSFFSVPKPKYSILNDFDDDVANLYLVIKDHKDEFVKEFAKCPISESLLDFWKQNKEQEPVLKAVRFLFLSNYTYLAKGDTLRIGLSNTKKVALNAVDIVFKAIENSLILNKDFRDVIASINFSRDILTLNDCFGYLDPPYLNTENTYQCPKWQESDTIDCFEIMKNSGIRCAMSEFDNPQVLDLVKKYGFHYEVIGRRRNIKKESVEILIMNYQNQNLFST